MSWRAAILSGVALVVIVGALAQGPVPQDPAYYLLADNRSMAGVPNFLNVMSNLPFLIFGFMGLRLLATNREVSTPATKMAWIVFFVGIALTALGSGYFHLNPNTATLIWDRLPMTIGFMSLVAIIIAEYFSPALGKKLLLPLLLVGIGSVVYWAYTESIGAGDLRPYAIVQFLPMLLIPLVIFLYPGESDLGRYIWWMIGFYLAAKGAEFFDVGVYAFGDAVSGHTVKHLLASLAPASLLFALMARRDRDVTQ